MLWPPGGRLYDLGASLPNKLTGGHPADELLAHFEVPVGSKLARFQPDSSLFAMSFEFGAPELSGPASFGIYVLMGDASVWHISPVKLPNDGSQAGQGSAPTRVEMVVSRLPCLLCLLPPCLPGSWLVRNTCQPPVAL